MQKSMRKTHSGAFKLKVVLGTYMGQKTISQICSEYKVHATQIHKWKNQFKEAGPEIFSRKTDPEKMELKDHIQELYKQIDQLTVEKDWLKKKSEFVAN